MLRVLDSRKLVVEKPLPKLLAEQVKLLLRKRKRKKTATRTSSESKRNWSRRNMLPKILPRKSLIRSNW